VLRNLLGITSAGKMNVVERRQLARATHLSFAACGRDQRFTASDICGFHRAWLGSIYPWAGEYRQVNLSKGGFMFAAANRISALMEQLECGPLRRYSPCRIGNPAELAWALAEAHAELVLIHPFREGNGRVARHFANLMIWQAGRLPMDFELMAGERKLEYFASIREALFGDYSRLQALFADLIGASARPRAPR
jgi:cell filamentation protein